MRADRSQRAAADAERARLAEHADAVRASRARLDAKSETLRRLSDLRDAALSRVRTAEQDADVSALCAAMAQAFAAVYVNPDGATITVEPNDGGLRDTKLPMSTRPTTCRSTGVAEQPAVTAPPYPRIRAVPRTAAALTTRMRFRARAGTRRARHGSS